MGNFSALVLLDSMENFEEKVTKLITPYFDMCDLVEFYETTPEAISHEFLQKLADPNNDEIYGTKKGSYVYRHLEFSTEGKILFPLPYDSKFHLVYGEFIEEKIYGVSEILAHFDEHGRDSYPEVFVDPDGFWIETRLHEEDLSEVLFVHYPNHFGIFLSMSD